MEERVECFCINCGEQVNNLYKKYSETVLKLTECEYCGKIADKYVEFDNVIVIIDLILLNTNAYRHILFNSQFKHYWKLSLILILLEAYSTMTLLNNPIKKCDRSIKAEPNLEDFDMNVEDLKFYIITLNLGISFVVFNIAIFCFTWIYYQKFSHNKSKMPSFNLIFKTITLASTGKFLQLPSIIWDLSVYDYHLHFITLYISLSQLLAYKVICSCPKLWCLITIFSSLTLKAMINDYLNIFLNFILK
ncbi:ACAT-related protein required for viability 1 [Rhynchophorus ferrugineus]|uniref:Protein ARV n=1 Tax=Rhynchophorus ferrugineus TaxID=354439 RepID=A0A834IJ02_RHYFE|nr:hypothetical protein GWI33_005621 [Rhynchophorus ferrugineus]